MAQFDFPSSPSTNQTYTSNGVTFKWDGVAWRRITSTGAQGAAGAQGASGTNGAQGASGTNGAQGATGAQGLAGTAASQGAQGASGTNGAQGATGSTGAQGASNIVNVKDYGATGDGNTDDRAAIQSAINAARVVFFPAGTYKVGAALTVWHSNSALIGHESLSAEIKVVGTGYSGPPISVQSAADNINEFSRIENLRLFFDYDGGGPATFSPTPNETNCGISINGSLAPTASATNRVLRFKMENCRVIGFSNGINLKETTNTLLKRIFIEHHTDNSSSVTHTSSNIYCGVNFDCTPGLEAGISPQASVELHQVVFNGSGAPANTTSMGFRITGQDPRDIFFEGCETAHGNYGWFIDPSDDDYNIDIHINRPIIDAVDNTGIYVKDWNGYGALTINGGYVVKDVNTTGAGIWVENSRGVNITGGIQVLGVSIKNAPGATSYDEGIRIKDSKLCSVSSSTIMNCQYGVSLQDSSNCTVTGNIIGAETGEFVGGVNPTLTDAIRIFGNSDTNTITGNTIKGANTSYKYFNGIIIAASTCEENMISSNAIDSTTVTNRISDAGVRTNIFDRGAIGISTATGGQLLVGGGTGAAVQFNDVNTRLEIPASNTLAAFTSNLERLRIDASGKLGLGMSSDQQSGLKGKLDIDASGIDAAGDTDDTNDYAIVIRNPSTTDSGNGIAFTNDGGTNVGGAIIHIDKGSNNIGDLAFLTSATTNNPEERLRITSGGAINIGLSIGTDPWGATGNVNTGVRLANSTTGYAISANSKEIVGIFNRTNTAGVIVEYKYNSSVVGSVITDGTNLELNSGALTKISAGGSERLRIASDGVITAQKSATFGNTSDSFTAVTILSSTSGVSELRLGDTTANAGYVKYEHTNNALIFATDANERLRITSTGQLNLVGNMQFTGANPELEFNNGGPRLRVPAANTLAIHNGGTIGSTNSEIIRIGSSGQIGLSGANYGTAGQVLTSQGSGSAPTWTNKGTGAQGATGSQGATGAQGSPGTNAGQGAQGSPGTTGAQGSPGTTGAQGSPGTTGAQGSPGTTGAQGASNTGGSGFVNAADYGLNASATNSTNVNAINSAISALGTNGGTIFFPGGQFYLNGAISLGGSNNSIRFVASGQQNYGGGGDSGGTVLRRDADDEFFNITNSRAIHFIGITFKGGASNGSGGNSGISGGNGAIYVVANAGCQGHLIENCVFHGIKNCIHFKGLSDSIIRGCRFRNVPSNEGAGALIKLDENGSEVIDQIRIQDCVLDGSPDGSSLNSNVDGIAIYNTVSTVYVTNTSAIRLNRSFYSDSSWDGNFFYFQNSEAERASSDGFSINGSGNFVTIDNCFSSTNNGHGINILSNQNSSVNITNPNVRDNSGHGILIDASSINNCSIVNPAIGGNSRGNTGTNHGIFIGTNVNNVYIAGGKIGGNTSELSGTGTQGRGILINGSSHSNIRIIGTNVSGNQDSEGIGASISSGSGNSIKFNAGSTVDVDT